MGLFDEMSDAMRWLGGGYNEDNAPDDSTPYVTKDGGWSTKALDDYLGGQSGDDGKGSGGWNDTFGL